MPDTTIATTGRLDMIRIFPQEGDREDVRFLRDAIREAVASDDDRITSAEPNLLDAF